MSCVFCEIVAGRSPATFVIQPGQVLGAVAFAPLSPVTPGHVLFVPDEHVANAAEVPRTTGFVFQLAADYAQVQGVPFNLITSAGPEATQTVFHLHVHYVPRREGDGLALPWTGQSPPAVHAPQQQPNDDPRAITTICPRDEHNCSCWGEGVCKP